MATGFAATDEASVNDGTGFVDVSLQRNGKRFAIEVSITTTAEWELHNITKCLAAGYDTVIVCSPYPTTIRNVQNLVRQKLTEEQRAKVLVLDPDALFAYFDDVRLKDATTEERVRGKIVRTEFTPLTDESAKHINQEVSKLASGPKKKRKKE